MEASPAPDELARIRERKLEELQRRMTAMSTEGPVEVTDDSFEDVVSGDGLVIVDCWAAWCGPCRMLGPIMDEAAKDYAGKVTIGKLNVDDNGATAQKFGIMSIPTILFFKGGEVVDRITGAIPREHLDKMIEKHS